MADTIRPDYYKPNSPYEPLKIIEAHDLNFNEGNTLKYLLRKDKSRSDYTRIEDLRKAITYLTFEVNRINGKESSDQSTRA